MSDKEKLDLIDQMIRENDNYTVLDYLKLLRELELIEKCVIQVRPDIKINHKYNGQQLR